MTFVAGTGCDLARHPDDLVHLPSVSMGCLYYIGYQQLRLKYQELHP